MRSTSMLFPVAMDDCSADDEHRPVSPPSSSPPPTTFNLVSPVRHSTTAATTTTTTLFHPPATDDLDIMLLHEDLPALLRLAARLQEATTTAATNTASTNGAPIVAERMQQALLSQPGETISRGRYPMVDAMLQDAMEQLRDSLQSFTVATPTAATTSAPSKASHKRKPSDSPIAVKYAKAQTDVLMQWMIDHQDNPFPTTQDLEHLSRKTGLTKTQVNNWATNVRKRNLKATCENGKKPHHFIDFLFHRRDREAKATKEQQQQQQHQFQSREDRRNGFVSDPVRARDMSVNRMFQQHSSQQTGRLHHGQAPSSFSPHHVVDLTQEPAHRRTPSFMAAAPQPLSTTNAPSWSLASVFDEVDAAMFGPVPGGNVVQQQPQPCQQPVQQQSQDPCRAVPSFDDEPYSWEREQPSPVQHTASETTATASVLERLHSGSIESLDDAELDKLVKELDGMNDVVV